MQELIGLSELKDKLSGKVRQLTNGEIDHLVVIRHSKPIAVMITAEEYERLMEAAK